MILMLLVAATTGTEWQVGGPTPHFVDLDTALAGILPGDTLLLAGGDWHGSYVPTIDVVVAPIPGETVRLVVDGSAGGGDPTDGFFRVDGGVSVTVRDLEIDGQDNYRIAKVLNGGLLRLERVYAHDGYHPDTTGGALFGWASGTRIELVDSTLADNAVLQQDEGSSTGGAVAVDNGVELLVERTRFEGNLASGNGGAVYCKGVCTILDSVFIGNESLNGDGGALLFTQGTAGSVVSGNLLCGNIANGSGGAIGISSGDGVDELAYNVLWGNVADSGGGVWAGVNLSLWNNDFVGNSANAAGAAIVASSGTTTSRNDLFVDHVNGDDLLGEDGGALDADWLLSSGNTVPLGVSPTPSAVVESDPLFVNRTNDCETSDLHLQPGSLAIDAGDPAIDDDIGAFPCDDLEVPGDGVDQDCDGSELCYEDYDQDGFGSEVLVAIAAGSCSVPGLSTVSLDCDDSDPWAFPGNPEQPVNGVDEDCDGLEACYADLDRDGYGDGVTTTGPLGCVGDAITDLVGDCDDADGQVYPGAPELCDDVDQDCDGQVQEDPPTWHDDLDRDGFGDPTTGEPRCEGEAGEVTDATDCDDGDPAVFPGSLEQCDGVDQDCDGAIDEDLGQACDPGPGGGDPDGRDPVSGGAEEVVGCGCVSGPGRAPWALVVAALPLVLRRRVARPPRPRRGWVSCGQ